MSSRVRSRLLALGIGTCLTFAIGEGGLRWLLFSHSRTAAQYGWRFRKPGLFVDRWDTDHWKLRFLFLPPVERRPPHHPHPVRGWTSTALDVDAVERELGDRRLVVLFGDSYTACLTPPEECWEGLLGASELADEYLVVNRGTGGYGVDQIYLSMTEELEQLARFDPLVVFGILLDDDLDRIALDFRQWPRPRFRLEDGELELTPPGSLDPRTYVRDNPVEVPSYLWRLFARGLLDDPASRAARELEAADETSKVAAALLRAAVDELDRRELEHFFVLFHGLSTLRAPELSGWREQLVVETLTELQEPFVSSRGALLRGGSIERSHFDGNGGHYSAAGNRVVFECIEDGLAGSFHGPASGNR